MNDGLQTDKLSVLEAAAKLLTFRLSRGEFLQLSYKHLAFGLLCTWVVGMGRWWDDPDASLLQRLGVGSLIYVFILAFILWLGTFLLRPKNWSYLHVLTFVSLTSPPAVLYAIPVEKFLSLGKANSANLLFLVVVASWRVALLVHYLKRHARLKPFAVAVSTMLPITGIVVVLTLLNLERAAFVSMGGFRGEPTAHDSAYNLLTFLTVLSILLFMPLVVCYIFLVLKAETSVDEQEVSD
jgi:hypothetical protein